jgi:hypothetical protein
MTDNIHEIVRRLNRSLGPTLVAALSGITDKSIPLQWQQYDSGEPDYAIINRLTAARYCWEQITAVEGESVARLWFISSSPWLNNDSPITAIREDKFDELKNAVQSMVDDSFSG